jgi:predicted DNA-binding protein (UPF0251 family)/predicted Fe-Mo cluster-binding NifX family protein
MARPFKCRRVAFMPGVTFFKPAGIPLRMLEEVRLTVEEAEAIRLKDLEGLEQEEGANKMNISRPTFQRILASAHQKMADALLNGKSIRIEGGNFEISPRHGLSESKQSEVKLMKIAAITDDGKTISQHFGRAPYYMVLTVEDGKITGKEKRDKAGHHTFTGHHEGAGHHGGHPAQGEPHGFDAGAQARHAGMMNNIADCQVLIAGGMGWGAYESLKSRDIEAIVTDVANIEEAAGRYLEGKLPNLMERLH